VSVSAGDAERLLAELQALSATRLDDFVRTVRARLPAPLRAKLPAPNALTARRQVAADLEAMIAWPEADAARALDVWVATARSELGESVGDRLDGLRSVMEDPGRDRGLGNVFVPEKTKIDLRDDLVGIDWLVRGTEAARSVAYLEVTRFFGGAPAGFIGGTAFLVGSDRRHLLTAYHVIEARDHDKNEAPPSKADLDLQIRGATAAFDYGDAVPAGAVRGTPLAIEELVVSDAALDYAVLRLAAPVAAAPLTLWTGGLPAISGTVGFVVNIVQHPQQRPKQLALRNNAVWQVAPRHLYYFTDTLGGSSGAPCFNDAWKVIAVHTGFDWFDKASYMGRNIGFSNRGTLVREILADLAARGVNLPLVVEQ